MSPELAFVLTLAMRMAFAAAFVIPGFSLMSGLTWMLASLVILSGT